MVPSYAQSFQLGQHATFVQNGGQSYYQTPMRYQQTGSMYIPVPSKFMLMVQVYFKVVLKNKLEGIKTQYLLSSANGRLLVMKCALANYFKAVVDGFPP